MDIPEFRRVLREFASQSRGGKFSDSANERARLAALAEQLDGSLGGLTHLQKSIYAEETITMAPNGKCACCGK